MTANPFAALLDGVPRRVIEDGGDALYHGKRTTYLPETEVLAALAAAVSDDLAEAGNANIVGLLEASRELAGYASYAEIVGGISVNRPQIRQWCDAVFEAMRTMPIDAESGERTAPDLPALFARIVAQEARIKGLQRTYDDLYSDALADAKSDAQCFESDLWKMVRSYLDELHFDWRDITEDGVTADEALTHIRECLDEETRRADAAEASLIAMTKERDELAERNKENSKLAEDNAQGLKEAETALAAERAKVAKLVEALEHEVKRSRRHLAASTLAALEDARAAITEVGQ